MARPRRAAAAAAAAAVAAADADPPALVWANEAVAAQADQVRSFVFINGLTVNKNPITDMSGNERLPGGARGPADTSTTLVRGCATPTEGVARQGHPAPCAL